MSRENRLIVTVLLAITYCAVNLFGLLSGYLKIDRPHRNASLISLLSQTFVWCFLIAVVCAVFFGERSAGAVIRNTFPFTVDRLWYITCYCFVFLCAPYLNLLVSQLTQKTYKAMLIILFILMSLIPTFLLRDYFHVVNQGYSGAWLVYMYLIGGYLKKFGFRKKRKSNKVFILLLLCVCILVASKYVFESILLKIGLNADKAWLLYYYCSPFTLLISVCFLYLFTNISIKGGILGRCFTWISKAAFGIYIIHAHPFSLDHILIGENFKWVIQDNGIVTFLLLVELIIGIVVFLGVLEHARALLFDFIGIEKVIMKMGAKIDALLNIEEVNDLVQRKH